MQFGDILVCIDESDSGRKRTEIAMAIAARSGARITGYYLPPRRGPLPVLDFLEMPATTVDDAALDFERQIESRNLDGVWIPGSKSRDLKDLLGYARCVDLIVVGLDVPDDPSSEAQGLDVERLVIDCGLPVLGIPIVSFSDTIGQNVMLAWDGSRECARALHDALPFLRDAASVRVTSIEGDPLSAHAPANAVAHLKRLGIAAELDTALDLHMPIGEEILSRIEREKVDLLVAGAYGHSRLWEHLFGGASRTLLHQMMVPVLVSH